MNTIARENRLESYIQRPLTKRQREILEVLGDKEMTARQICQKMRHTDMNFVRPRLTELERMGKVEIIGKAYDKLTQRNTSLYRRVK